MTYKHCETTEKYISLHDCQASKGYFRDGILCFVFDDGFWIADSHPENNLDVTVRTNLSRVEYVLEDGGDYDVSVYAFENSPDGKVIRTEIPLGEFVDNINSGKYKLEFIYQYIGDFARILECNLINDNTEYLECILKISAKSVNYYWNDLMPEKVW